MSKECTQSTPVDKMPPGQINDMPGHAYHYCQKEVVFPPPKYTSREFHPVAKDTDTLIDFVKH